MNAPSKRMQAAQARLIAAQAAADDAAAAALPVRRRLARRDGTLLRAALVVMAAMLVAVAVVGVAVAIRHRGFDDRQQRIGAAIAAARTSLVTLLTADPSKPDEYIESILGVTTGDQNHRIVEVRDQIRDAVATGGKPSTGAVISIGIIGPDPGSSVNMFAVATATNPELVGASSGQNRFALVITMRAVGRPTDSRGWKLANAQAQ